MIAALNAVADRRQRLLWLKSCPQLSRHLLVPPAQDFAKALAPATLLDTAQLPDLQATKDLAQGQVIQLKDLHGRGLSQLVTPSNTKKI